MVFLYSSVKLSRQKRFIMDVFPTAPLPTTSTLTSFSNSSSICEAGKSRTGVSVGGETGDARETGGRRTRV